MIKTQFIRTFGWMPFLLSTTFVLVGCEAVQQIDRGLYQVADSVSERDRITGKRTLSTASRGQQIAQGNQVIKQLIAAEKKAGRSINSALNKREYERLVRVFDRIHQVSHLNKERWEPVLIDRDSFNAFTTGGTYIVVHDGLMKQLKSDDELAAVLGHEIAHTVANHVFERQTHQMTTLITGSSAAKRSGYQAALTHESEIEADEVGILYAALAGFDPYAASRIWARQYQQQGSARGLFFHDHPVNKERAALTRQVADKVKTYYRRGRQNPNYEALRENNTLWRKRDDQRIAGEGGGLAAVLGTALGAYVQHQETKIEANRQAQQIQMMRALNSNIRVLEQRKLDNHRWRVVWQNRNNVSLANVVMGVIIKDAKGNIKRYVTHIKGNVARGARFSGIFSTPDLSIAELKKRQVAYYLDDATPYR